MFPLIISTYPENGSTEVQLNNPIVVEFSDVMDEMTITTSHVKLENINLATSVPVTMVYDDSINGITITPKDDAYGNMLLGSTSYKLSLWGLQGQYGDIMQGTYTLEFTTISDSITSIIDPVDIDENFAVVNTFPKESSINTTPTDIRVKFNRGVLDTSVTTNTFIVTSDPVDAIEDIGFIEMVMIEGTFAVDSSVITFTPTVALSDNTKYTLVLYGILSVDNERLEPMIYSFNTKVTPAYTNPTDILKGYPSLGPIIKSLNILELYDYIKSNGEMAEFIGTANTNIDWTNPPRYVVEYVKAKTRYDIVFDRYIQLSNEASAKTLADLSIEYHTNLKDLLAMADRLKGMYEYWENMIKGSTIGKSRPATFVKGETGDENPDFLSRKFKDIDGTKSW